MTGIPQAKFSGAEPEPERRAAGNAPRPKPEAAPKPRGRANGEGSIYPYKNGYAAYAWVTTPDGERKRKYVTGKTRELVHDKWLKLHAAAKAGPVVTNSQTVADYLSYWLKEVITEPDYAPQTIALYEVYARLYIIPGVGKYRLDRLTVRHIREWLTKMRGTCQCCAQGKDASRKPEKRRCCAIGKCCEQRLSEYTVQGILRAFRSALSNAVREEQIPKNVAAVVRVSTPRRARKVKPWSVAEAQQFLASARESADSLYAAFVLILVLGLRRGEVLGLAWERIDLDKAELYVGEQIQRVSRKLLRRETKTESSDAPLPLPAICVAALRIRQTEQDRGRERNKSRWQENGLVFTTRHGTPIEPRNFNRSFDNRIAKAAVRRIKLHGTRKTCGTLLAALDVHPRVAMQILRHSQISVTMEIYTEATTQATRDALKRLGDELSPPTEDNNPAAPGTAPEAP
jgi:integrase